MQIGFGMMMRLAEQVPPVMAPLLWVPGVLASPSTYEFGNHSLNRTS
jgi:hypothetical protein